MFSLVFKWSIDFSHFTDSGLLCYIFLNGERKVEGQRGRGSLATLPPFTPVLWSLVNSLLPISNTITVTQ